MSGKLARKISSPSISSAADSPARMSRRLAGALALRVLEAACGANSSEWSASLLPPSWWLRTSLPALRAGLMRSDATWNSLAMRVYRSRCRQAIAELRTDGAEFSLLPTLTVSGNTNRKGASPTSGDGLRTALLPTLVASFGPGNKGGQNRNGRWRPSLVELARKGELPTLTTRDEKGPGPASKSKGGKDLPSTLGGHLNPEWCRWFMGFPVGWLDVEDTHVFARSATRSSRSARKSSGKS